MHPQDTQNIDTWVCFSIYFKPMVFLQKHTPLQRHYLPLTTISALSHISPNIILNYLCVTLGTLPQLLTLTQFAVSICKPVSFFPPNFATLLRVVSFLVQCRDLGSGNSPPTLKFSRIFIPCQSNTSKIHSSINKVVKHILSPSLYLKTYHPT